MELLLSLPPLHLMVEKEAMAVATYNDIRKIKTKTADLQTVQRFKKVQELGFNIRPHVGPLV